MSKFSKSLDCVAKTAKAGHKWSPSQSLFGRVTQRSARQRVA